MPPATAEALPGVLRNRGTREFISGEQGRVSIIDWASFRHPFSVHKVKVGSCAVTCTHIEVFYYFVIHCSFGYRQCYIKVQVFGPRFILKYKFYGSTIFRMIFMHRLWLKTTVHQTSGRCSNGSCSMLQA